MQKQVQYIIKGMNRDMSISKYPSDHSYENKNIRITQREDETLLSVTNEKGPSEVVLSQPISGVIVGHCAIREYLVLFVKQTSGTTPQYEIITNTIYRVTPETGSTKILVQSSDNYYPGGKNSFEKSSLLFGNNIQAFGVYESDSVIKVYWVDNKNQNRFINIVNPKFTWTGVNDRYKPNDLNFVPLQDFNETVSVVREDSSNGVFAPGTIQYMCTYYNMYGQETAFFFYSDLYYTSHSDRGGSEEENVSNSFRITIEDADSSFEYVRVYSILRTSLNGTPQCRIVADRNIIAGEDITIVDNGAIGSNFDYNALLFMCGDVFSSRTMAAKDDTLFNGNLTLLVPNIPEDIKEYFRKSIVTANHASETNSSVIISYQALKPYSVGSKGGHYPYDIHLNEAQGDITTFKYLETYRFGIQFLHKTGKWSDVVYLDDVMNTEKIATTFNAPGNSMYLVRADIAFTPGNDFDYRWFSENGFTKMRPVVVYPRLCDRSIVAQGIVCPTLYNVEDRKGNRPFVYPSWYARPNAGAQNTVSYGTNLINKVGNSTGVSNEYRHNKQLPKNTEVNSEIQCTLDAGLSPIISDAQYDTPNKVLSWVQNHKETFFVDKSIITFHSPELELSDDLDVLDLTKLKFRIVGIAPMTSFASDLYLSTSTIGNLTWNRWFREHYYQKNNSRENVEPKGNTNFGPGFYDETIGAENISEDGWKCRMGNVNWIDEETNYCDTIDHLDRTTNSEDAIKWYGFFVYPWHRSKSLNNTSAPDENGWESALLENKIITNSRYSYNNFYFNKTVQNGVLKPYVWDPEALDSGISGVKLANIEPQSEESEISLTKIPAPKNSDLGDLNYYSTVDKVVVPSNTTIVNTSDKSLGIWKGRGYPFVIAASTRITDMCQDGKCRVGGTGDNGYRQRAASFHEIFHGLYDQRSNYSAAEVNHPQGTLLEYMPEKWADQSYSGHQREDNYDWRDVYINKTEIQSYWNISTFDPIRIRYKSTKHAVMAFNYTTARHQVILPRFSGETSNEGNAGYNNARFFWEMDKTNYALAVDQAIIDTNAAGSNSTYGYLFIGELYRDIDEDTRFGGKNEDALEKNTWLPAGEADDIPYNSQVVLHADRGDTYYQRYDCLKTYPFTPDEKNAMVETVSFMCETHLNIDGRYDKNRGNATKFTLTPKNFNLMNNAYNQTNNFFNYQYYNSNRLYPNHFNQISWSQTKSAMNEIDTWTKLNLSSLLDMDGEKGEIVALVFFGNEIWCFQERGIAKILFNNRVQIPVSDGVPIEITNGMKVQGKIYITDKAGCQNKFAMTITPNGVYFIDGYNNNICLFNGQQLQNLSDIKGFKQWMTTQDGITEWIRNMYSENVVGFRIEYDSDNQDVYFINNDHCLVFSEMLAEFTSFMDYNKVRGSGNVKGNFYMLTDFSQAVKVWKMFDGEYNMFFKPANVPDEIVPEDPEEETTYPWKAYYKPFYIQYNVNPDPTFDKTFDNVEFRSDSWDTGSLVTSPDSDGANKTFDTLEVENEYQYGILPLTFTHAQYSKDSTLKRKFRVWRTIMPREQDTRNRIRNTWCKVKLSWNTPNRYKTVLHDTIIKYFL